MDRHGPMVLRVCRSVLDKDHDAEDAFQVTFLVLARKAGSIRKQKSIGSWLHGVAHRVALKARIAARRRRARIAGGGGGGVAESSEPDTDSRRCSTRRSRDCPRNTGAPIVLCYLEGMTQDQAARELGWPVGTVRGRLARARDLLRTRLTRRGLTLSAGLAAVDSLSETASAAIPAALREATIKAALGSAAAGVLSRTATLLLEAVLKKMAVTRFLQWAAPLLLIAIVASGAALVVYPGRTKLSGERTTIAKVEPVRPPVPTDLSGDPLPDGALARLGTTRFLHEYFATQVSYSPDGATLASFDGALHLWDPATGRLRHHIETGAGRGSGHVPFAYAPDGRSLAVQGDIGTSLYDANTGRLIRRFAGEGQPYGLTFSTDGQMLAAGHYNEEHKHVITLWDVASGRVIRRIDCPPLAVALAFLPDGKALVSAAVEQRSEPPRPGRRTPPGRRPRRAPFTSGTSPPGRSYAASGWGTRGSITPCSRPTARPWPRRRPTRRSGFGTSPRARKPADSERATRNHEVSRSRPTARSWRPRKRSAPISRPSARAGPSPVRSRSGRRPRAGSWAVGRRTTARSPARSRPMARLWPREVGRSSGSGMWPAIGKSSHNRAIARRSATRPSRPMAARL